jgi:hypothetical protein
MKLQHIAVAGLALVAVALLGVYGWISSTGGDTKEFLGALSTLSIPTLLASLLALSRTTKLGDEVAEVKGTTETVQKQTNGNLSRQHDLTERLIGALEQNGVNTAAVVAQHEDEQARKAVDVDVHQADDPLGPVVPTQDERRTRRAIGGAMWIPPAGGPGTPGTPGGTAR